MNNISIIMPCEENRKSLLMNTLEAYRKQGISEGIEFLIISRTITEVSYPHVPIRLIKYEYPGEYINPSMALNLGVKHAKYPNVMITCPEVMPKTPVLSQVDLLPEGNYVFQVFDLDENGNEVMSLVNKAFRGDTPAMYFLALFKKSDIEFINGWDERFMEGIAFEDNDFGRRFMRAGLHFRLIEAIQGVHQFHQRFDGSSTLVSRNKLLYEENNKNGTILAVRGLRE